MNHPDMIIPQTLPCGCNAISTAGNRKVLRLYDGTKVCSTHKKRYRLVYEEIKLGDGGQT